MGRVTESKELSVAAGGEAELNAPQGTVSENLMRVPEGLPPPEQEETEREESREPSVKRGLEEIPDDPESIKKIQSD